jgi:hypothetical protein
LIRIGRLNAENFDFVDNPDGALDELRKSGMGIDVFTFLQRLCDSSPRYPYPMEWDNVADLPVSTYDEWWAKQIDNKTRNMVRRAEKKGVELREVAFDEALVRGIWSIYNETSVRQGKPFRHYGKDIDTVRREAATFLDRSVFLGAFHNQELIGFIKLTHDETRSQSGIMNIISLVQQRDRAPVNALLACAVRSCAERKIPFLVYASFSYGKKQRDSLADFKRNNGFKRVDLPRYYVPLTRVGSVALSLGLHKRFADYVPGPLLARLRDLRHAWYNRKSRSLAEARST